ncbi:lipocalin-like domain-containing protein [Mycobacterium deserti]|uniref:Secreted hydrolase n=1 Tax=Mycobacterium deserti TaxID=2978347 RepID=A0ABT2MID8_9MYCO|nr:lipocalin-like domain-containing protein [Mycobacterium deserti]MCT7662031.1 secreted hydrolase [Mycobacterium deserti]
MDHHQSDDWRRYPFRLVTGDTQFDFPAAEANHPQCESDTWFLAGELTAESGRRYAFLSIFNKNRPGQAIVADFYTLALFDIDVGAYGTFTDYDMPGSNLRSGSNPKLSVADDHLDITFDSRAGTAQWRTCRDEGGRLVPYTYDVTFVGRDQAGAQMRLDLRVTPSRAPVPLGAATHNGRIECFGQADTYSYFQTGMSMSGSLSWGSVTEHVAGNAGHVDRQWFPLVANSGGPDGDIRSRAHEWRTINLDNGVDLSIWRQFDRTNRNAVEPFSGVTTSSPVADPEYADDVEVEVFSYVRWPEAIRTLVPPPAPVRYMPDRHRLTSRALDLDLTGDPLVAAPAHGLPLEYMEGPYRYQGMLRGVPVSGFGFYERSLALYRDWELADVLAAADSEQRDDVARVIDGLHRI